VLLIQQYDGVVESYSSEVDEFFISGNLSNESFICGKRLN
jgi:hypothetical protein